ncbi:hypothetical protein K9M79_05505 [Candidatus Woesearchaeota archaeon]|nr:hypothetical protein [Candidatus Woesearchaeota archaeon]
MNSFNILSNESFFESIRALRITRDGKPISPGELFNDTYSGLEDLFAFNRNNRKETESYYKGARGKHLKGSEEEHDSQRQKIIAKWKADFYKLQLGLTIDSAVIIADSLFTQTEEGMISPRTKLEMDRERRPSIIQVSDNLGNSLYLRSQIHYQNLGMFAEFRDFGLTTTNNPDTLLNLMSKGVIDHAWNYRFYNQSARAVSSRTELRFEKPYVYIPEPHLNNVLEELYKEGVPRITPTVKIINVDGRNQYIIRPSLKKIVDISLDQTVMAKLGEYYGVLHALGLCDHNDRQVEHYALQKLPHSHVKTRVVNFDPDYMLLDRRPLKSSRYHSDLDARAFLMELGQEENYISKADYKIFREARNSMIEFMVDLIGKKDLDSEFLRRLRPNLRDYPIAKDTSVYIKCNQE